jgi:hypothetical protein
MGSCCSIFSLLSNILWIVVCPFIIFLLYILCCLSFFDLRILITPLVSSNSSYNHIVKRSVHVTQIMVDF